MSKALWVLFTHSFAAHDVSPRLALLSPVHGCGKTTALIILRYVCPNSLLLSNITPAAVFRYIEKKRVQGRPTLLLDEGGTYLETNEAFRGILNSGHTKAGAVVLRTVTKGRDYDVQTFSTWAPIAMAKIGVLQPEWASRSIIISLQRKRPDEHLERLKGRDIEQLGHLAGRIARWAKPAIERLRDADPAIPPMLINRAADNWRPLIAIAELAGGNWPAKVHEVALVLSDDAAAPGEELLSAIQRAFDECGRDRLSSEDLCKLLENDDRFPEISQKSLARQLKPFGIRPRGMRFGARVVRGFQREWFEDAFARYVSPSTTSVTPQQSNGVRE